MKGLTKRQEEILAFIRKYKEENGYPPVNREIAAHFSISVKAAHDHIKALQKKNKITLVKGRSRTLECTPDSTLEKTRDIPLLGEVAAGIPIHAEENYDGNITIPSTLLHAQKKYFALRVEGESMIGDGILDGDIAIIQYQNTANNGDIIVARVGDKPVTLKRFYREPSRIRLEASNEKFIDIFSKDVSVVGKLHMIFRTYGS